MLLADRAVDRLARHGGMLQTVLVTGPAGSARPEAVIAPDLRAHRRYAATRGRLLLVRPDGYLAADAPLGEPEILERYLMKLARRPPQDEAANVDGKRSGLSAQPAGAAIV